MLKIYVKEEIKKKNFNSVNAFDPKTILRLFLFFYSFFLFFRVCFIYSFCYCRVFFSNHVTTTPTCPQHHRRICQIWLSHAAEAETVENTKRHFYINISPFSHRLSSPPPRTATILDPFPSLSLSLIHPFYTIYIPSYTFPLSLNHFVRRKFMCRECWISSTATLTRPFSWLQFSKLSVPEECTNHFCLLFFNPYSFVWICMNSHLGVTIPVFYRLFL